MRLIITFEKKDGHLSLPIHYNYVIQKFIYSNISKELASFLHGKGYGYGKRAFKLFTFSRLYGKSTLSRVDEKIMFESPIHLQIASSDNHFIQEFAETLLKKVRIKISNQPIMIHSIEILPTPKFKKEMLIKTLSPITVYSTLSKSDGKKKTYYYSPYEKEFSSLIRDNLIKKFKIIYNKEPDTHNFVIEVVDSKRVSEKIIKYKDFIIKGWMGRFKLKGSPTLISVAYDTGLGSKNSQGFGMFEVVS